MPRPKGYKLSEETKNKISESHKGLRHTEESKKEMSRTRKGRIPPNKGKKASEETRKKMSESAIKKCSNPEYRKLMSERAKEKWSDLEYREWYCNHLKELHKEHPEWNEKSKAARKGIRPSEETRRKMSESHRKTVRTYRHSEETKKKLSEYCGEKASNWRGGISFEPYCIRFNKKFKNYIRNKFNNECFLCNKLETDNLINNKIHKLHVHHIDYNKNSICNGKEWAFVPLCSRCHGKTSHNRWYWFNLLINYWIYNNSIILDYEVSKWQT